MKDIFTERLLLRKYLEQDYDVLYRTWIDYMSTHKDVNREDLSLVDSWIKNYYYKVYCWVAEDRMLGSVVGNINVIKKSIKHKNCELAYAVDPNKRQMGYATEMLKAVLNYLITEEKFHVIEARHYSGNPNSGKVMKKAGMQKEAELVDRRYNFKTGKF